MEGRDYEPADRLLERILAERRARWEAQEKRRGKYEEASSPDTSDTAGTARGLGVDDALSDFRVEGWRNQGNRRFQRWRVTSKTEVPYFRMAHVQLAANKLCPQLR